ncbi:MAG: hypothetical protein ACRDS9_00850 [Pseudonocardiaceae bacterium]
MKKSIEQMESERRALDREIRAAKRAAAKQAEQQLLFERQALGVWLTESVGADTLDAVATLRTAFDPGQLAVLRASLHPPARDEGAQNPAVEEAETSDTSAIAGITSAANASSEIPAGPSEVPVQIPTPHPDGATRDDRAR